MGYVRLRNHNIRYLPLAEKRLWIMKPAGKNLAEYENHKNPLSHSIYWTQVLIGDFRVVKLQTILTHDNSFSNL